jgi:hypothetical protein
MNLKYNIIPLFRGFLAPVTEQSKSGNRADAAEIGSQTRQNCVCNYSVDNIYLIIGKDEAARLS